MYFLNNTWKPWNGCSGMGLAGCGLHWDGMILTCRSSFLLSWAAECGWKWEERMAEVAWGCAPSLQLLTQVPCCSRVSNGKSALAWAKLAYGCNSTLIFPWRFFMLGTWYSKREMLFEAITAIKEEQAGIPDLNSTSIARGMEVTWIAAGSWVLSLRSVQDLCFASWQGDSAIFPV